MELQKLLVDYTCSLGKDEAGRVIYDLIAEWHKGIVTRKTLFSWAEKRQRERKALMDRHRKALNRRGWKDSGEEDV